MTVNPARHFDARITMTATSPPSSRSNVPADSARSWLLVSALRLKAFANEGSNADQIIIDIEDAVDPSLKAAARDEVADWLVGPASAWVRVNDEGSAFWEDDLAALRGLPGLRGVVLAKAERAEQVWRTSERLGGATPVIPLVESAVGIESASEIARARGAFRLAFGSGDYRRDTGASAADLAMAYPRSRLVVSSRAAGLPGPIDGPAVGATAASVRDQSLLAGDLGMTGKLCLREDDVAVVNDALAPAPSEVAWARNFISEFERDGRKIRDGSDLPRLGRAEKVDSLARLFGVEPSAAPDGISRLGY